MARIQINLRISSEKLAELVAAAERMGVTRTKLLMEGVDLVIARERGVVVVVEPSAPKPPRGRIKEPKGMVGAVYTGYANGAAKRVTSPKTVVVRAEKRAPHLGMGVPLGPQPVAAGSRLKAKK